MRRARKSINQINVVPYIDVMLVLLVIFMVTAPLMNPGKVDLPSVGKALHRLRSHAAGSHHQSSTEPGGARPRCQGRGADERKVSREERTRRLRDKQRRRPPDQPVVISADKSVRYEEVVNVMDLLQRRQVKRVGLLGAAPQ